LTDWSLVVEIPLLGIVVTMLPILLFSAVASLLVLLIMFRLFHYLYRHLVSPSIALVTRIEELSNEINRLAMDRQNDLSLLKAQSDATQEGVLVVSPAGLIMEACGWSRMDFRKGLRFAWNCPLPP